MAYIWEPLSKFILSTPHEQLLKVRTYCSNNTGLGLHIINIKKDLA